MNFVRMSACHSVVKVASVTTREPATDTRGHSSAGRAPGLHPGGLRFDPAWLHHQSLPLHDGQLN